MIAHGGIFDGGGMELLVGGKIRIELAVFF